MSPIQKKLLGLLAIAIGVWFAIEAVSTPGGMGPVFREWTGLSDHSGRNDQQPAQPNGPISDIPTPTDPLSK